jgi:hypothetical protein
VTEAEPLQLPGQLHHRLPSVLRIQDILGWIRIRIRGSMSLTNGSGSGFWIRILLFSSLTFKMPAKNWFLNTIISAYYHTFWSYIYIIFQR